MKTFVTPVLQCFPSLVLINNVRPDPERYIDYVLTSGVKLDHWCKDELYEKYVLNFILKEDVTTALERSVQTMMEWAEENELRHESLF